jgi:hypothetical protein
LQHSWTSFTKNRILSGCLPLPAAIEESSDPNEAVVAYLDERRSLGSWVLLAFLSEQDLEQSQPPTGVKSLLGTVE